MKSLSYVKMSNPLNLKILIVKTGEPTASEFTLILQ